MKKTAKKSATKPETKETKTKETYIERNKVKVLFSDDYKLCKQNVAVATVLLCGIISENPACGALINMFCAVTAQYSNGKKEITKDAGKNGNGVYLRNAVRGLEGNGNTWVHNAVAKIRKGTATGDILMASALVMKAHNTSKTALLSAVKKQKAKAKKEEQLMYSQLETAINQ